MNHFDDEPVRVSILGVVGRLTCAQENEVYLRLLKLPEYIELNTLERVLEAMRGNRQFGEPDLWEWARRRSELSPILCPIVAKLMHEVTQWDERAEQEADRLRAENAKLRAKCEERKAWIEKNDPLEWTEGGTMRCHTCGVYLYQESKHSEDCAWKRAMEDV